MSKFTPKQLGSFFAGESAQSKTVYAGAIKCILEDRGFGFISCAEATREYGCDVFFKRDQIQMLKEGDMVEFQVQVGAAGKPQARDLLPLRKGGLPKKTGGGAEQAAPDKHGAICCFYLQRRCRLDPCIDRHEEDDEKACSNMQRNCKMHRDRNKLFGVVTGKPGSSRYDPIAAAARAAGKSLEAAPIGAIKPLTADQRPSIPPPGQGVAHQLPAYMLRQRDAATMNFDVPKWKGKIMAVPGQPGGPTDRGMIDSPQAREEYGCIVWATANALLEFDLGEDVEFELVMDDESKPQGRALTEPTGAAVWKKASGEAPVQNRGAAFAQGVGIKGAVGHIAQASIDRAKQQKLYNQGMEKHSQMTAQASKAGLFHHTRPVERPAGGFQVPGMKMMAPPPR